MANTGDIRNIVLFGHGGKLINIIDTPGYPDFIGAAIRAIPAAETARRANGQADFLLERGKP